VVEPKKVYAREMRFKGAFSNIGLDIGSFQVKLAQYKSRGGQIYLHQYGIYPLSEGVVEGGRVIDPETLGNQLRWIVRQRRFKKNKVNLCVSSQNVILRHVVFPMMSSKEIPDALRWEAEKHIMIPPEDAVIDYIQLGERVVEGKQVIEVLLVAVPKDVVNSYIEAVTRAGLYPEVVEIEPFSLQRTIQQTFEGRPMGPEPFLLLDIGGDGSSLLVLQGGNYCFSRTFNVGTFDFCRRVSELNEVDLETARRMVFGLDAFSVEGMTEVADELVQQIRRSLDYIVYKMRRLERDFNSLYLCGGGTFIEGLNKYLEQQLGVEINNFNPLSFVNLDRRFMQIESEQNLLSIASGLALRGWVL